MDIDITLINSSNPNTQNLLDETPGSEIDESAFTGIISLRLCVALLATAGNLLNIVVYFRLGFSESTNISLITLAFSDLFISFSSGCNALIYLLPFLQEYLIPSEATFTTIGCPNLVFTRFSALITSYLSLERYLCVLVPLKIKHIITPRRTFMVMIFIFIISVPPMLVVYFRYPLGMRYVPERNKTLFGILPNEEEKIDTLYTIWLVYSANILTFTTFFTVVTCTILLAFSLRESKAWRNNNRHVTYAATSSSDKGHYKEDQLAKEQKPDSKETRAVKMVVAIATVFILCTIPSVVHVVASMTVPGFQIDGQHADLFILTGHILSVADSINAGTNLLIYYIMSTKFRTAVRELACSSFRGISTNIGK